MKYGYYPGEFGYWVIGYRDNLVYSLQISKALPWVVNCCNDFTDQVMAKVEDYLVGRSKNLEIPYVLVGTAWQRKVWEGAREIPYGSVITYGALAECLGGSPRAVGQALGRNPLLLLVPCHRIVGKGGKLTGYAGGLELKAYLLALEKNKKGS